MAQHDTQHAFERADRLIDQENRLIEGAIIDWLIRTGQWDSRADEKIQAWLEKNEPQFVSAEEPPHAKN